MSKTKFGTLIGMALLSTWLGFSASLVHAGGREVYASKCLLCHQAGGQGLPGLAPPLSINPPRLAATDAGRHFLASLLLHGMVGPVEIEGKQYNAAMPGVPTVSDEDLAETLNHVLFDLAKPPAGRHVARFTAAEIHRQRATSETPVAVRERRADAVRKMRP